MQVTIIGYKLLEQNFKSGKHNHVLELIAKRQNDTNFVFKRIVYSEPNWLVRSYFDRFERIV